MSLPLLPAPVMAQAQPLLDPFPGARLLPELPPSFMTFSPASGPPLLLEPLLLELPLLELLLLTEPPLLEPLLELALPLDPPLLEALPPLLEPLLPPLLPPLDPPLLPPLDPPLLPPLDPPLLPPLDPPLLPPLLLLDDMPNVASAVAFGVPMPDGPSHPVPALHSLPHELGLEESVLEPDESTGYEEDPRSWKPVGFS
jgi:hypothetical protein